MRPTLERRPATSAESRRVAAVALLALAMQHSLLASAAPLQPLTVIDCVDGSVALDVRQAEVDVDGQLSFTTRAYHVNGELAMPGPVIRMKAGTQCSIEVTNSLPEGQEAGCPHHSNEFHCPDTTNLHTHGLHVSPYEDNIDTSINPGESLTYSYSVPADHLMGTHWLHGHHHGSTTLQVMGGMAGVILMDKADDYELQSDLAALYESDSNQHTMLLWHASFGGSDEGADDPTSQLYPFAMMDYPTVSASYDTQTIAANPTYADGGERDFLAVNGQYQPSVDMEAGDTILLRLVHATGARMSFLRPAADTSCEMTLLARDGVFQYTPYPQIDRIALAPGTRADVALHCPTSEAGTVLVFEAQHDTATILSSENIHEQANVFTVNVGATVAASPIAVPTSQATLPAYLTSLLNAELSTGSQGVSSIQLAVTGAGLETINGVSFGGYDAPQCDRYVERMCKDKVYEFSVVPPGPPGRRLRRRLQPPGGGPPGGGPPGGGGGGGGGGATGAHPYHQHIWHFQVTDLNGAEAGDPEIMRVGEWRDVVPAPAPLGVTIRTNTVDFTGETILHCHILQHEDRGMMGLYEITECAPNAGPPADCRGQGDGGGDASVGGGDGDETDDGDDSGSGSRGGEDSAAASTRVSSLVAAVVAAMACVAAWRECQ